LLFDGSQMNGARQESACARVAEPRSTNWFESGAPPDTGHVSGVDPLFGLDRAARAGDLRGGELVLLLAAGTGYTWAATVVRWGDATV
jgi:3-oxoacyl-[acyl-carrier-protein] synthase III